MPESQITPANVKDLRVAWVFHTHVFDKASKASNWRASFEATPILWRGVLYFDSPFNQVFAVDAATGALRWSFDPKVDREGDIYIVTSRGVALWHSPKPHPGVCGSDVVFVATNARKLMARDAQTGAACPRFGSDGAVDLMQGVRNTGPGSLGYTSPPEVVGDTVVLGSCVPDNQAAYRASGAVRGFDAVTGAQKWSWEPVRWTGNAGPPSSGSGNAWAPLTGDPEHDLVFVPTGSASSDFYGGTRLGDNRDADSILALRASTGEKVWSFQLVHHDLWDYDTPSQPLLFTFHGNVPAVAVTTKTSMVYVFNRLTGEPLYPIEERRVAASTLPGEQAWPTQPFSTLPSLTPLSFTPADVHLSNLDDQKYCAGILSPLVNEGLFTPPSRKGSLIYPGSLGGSNWGSSAFDPQSGVLYTRVSSVPYLVRELPAYRKDSLSDSFHRELQQNLPPFLGGDPHALPTDLNTPDTGGVETPDESPQSGTPYRLQRQGIETPGGTPCAPTPFGAIVATNLQTGKQVWRVAHGQMIKGEPGSIGVGGVMVTQGGLVFGASTNDGLFRAYDARSGVEVWHTALPAPANATPMSYAVNGRQFVVIAAGGHGFVGLGKSDEVIAYALPVTKPAQHKR